MQPEECIKTDRICIAIVLIIAIVAIVGGLWGAKTYGYVDTCSGRYINWPSPFEVVSNTDCNCNHGHAQGTT